MSDNLIDEIEQGLLAFVRGCNREPEAREKVLRALADEMQRYVQLCQVEARQLELDRVEGKLRLWGINV